MSKRTISVALVLAGLMAMGGGLLWTLMSRSAWEPGWGRGQFQVAEWAYYRDQIENIIGTWQTMAREATRQPRTGRVTEDGFVCLTIDTAEKAMWIERDGQVLPEYRSGLPEPMRWKLRHCGPHANAELAGPARFRIRGIYASRQPLERIFLVGELAGQGYLEFSFDASDRYSGNGSGTWAPNITWDLAREKRKADEPYESLVVSDAEYAKAQAGFPAGDTQAEPGQPAQLAANRAAWARFGQRLGQEIDRHVAAEGFKLGSLMVRCGPDCSAASANLRATRTGWLRKFLGLRSSAQAYLKIDRLEGDIWYVKTAPDPKGPAPKGSRLKLEFVASASGELTRDRRARLIRAGRTKQADAPKPPSKWQIELPNGVKVAFIGVCGKLSGDKECWGPDGSRLGYTPHRNYEQYTPIGGDQTVYEIAWRVTRPAGGGSGTRTSLEGYRGTFGRPICDRYGNPTPSGFHAQAYVFDKSQKKTTLKLGIRTGDGAYEWVRFENISLVPGENPGFQIMLGPGETEAP